MPNINDRIGSQNVIRVLSNASAPPTRIVNLTDVESSRKTEDGMLLVWDVSTEKFFMTDAIDSASLTVTGIATFSNTTQSSSISTGALVVNGGVGIAKEVHIGEGITVAGISTFSSALDINAAVDILNGLKVNQNFESVGITTLASSGGITTTGGNLFVGSNLTVASNLKVDGTSEFIGNATFRGGTIGIGDSTGDDIDVGGEFVSNLVPNTDNTYDIGITTQRWRDGKFAGLVTSTTLNVSSVATLNNLNVTGVATFSNVDLNGNVDIDGDTELDNLNVSGLSTFAGTADFNGILDTTGGRIVGAATSNVIPFLYSALSDLPSAATYHGAFAHVHATGKAYYAHAGNWWELVNRNLDGTVGTGTDTYNIGTLGVTGLSTSQNLTVVGLTTLGAAGSSGITTTLGDLYVGGDLYVNDDITLDEVTLRNADITGIATIGTLGVTGLTTTQDLRVAGLSTFVGIATFSTNVFVAGTLDAGLIDGGEF